MQVTISERLSELLNEKNMNVSALADKIGVSTVFVWVRENSSVSLCHLLKLASYFECSVDFICGRTDEQGKFNPAEPTFPARFITLIEKLGKPQNEIFEKLGMNRHALYDWKKGSSPLSNSLIAIADYFGCTVDYLIGIED